MKKLMLLVTTITLCTAALFAQLQDTTQLKMGKKKILIIEEDSRSAYEKLDSGKEAFQDQVDELRANLKQLTDSAADLSTESESYRSIQRQKQEMNDQITALQKGINDIDEELATLKKGYSPPAEDLSKNQWDWSYHPKKKEKKTNTFEPHWAGLDIGYTSLLDKNYEHNLPAEFNFMELDANESFGVGLNLFDIGLPVFRKSAGFVTGVGIEWHNYRFKNYFELGTNAQNQLVPIDLNDPTKRLIKNKLTTSYLTVPLLFEIQAPTLKGKRKFFASAGVVGGVRLTAKTKQKFEENGYTQKQKTRDDFRTNRFRYGFTARVGYGMARLFVNYYLTPIFRQNSGPENCPVTIGLSFFNL